MKPKITWKNHPRYHSMLYGFVAKVRLFEIEPEAGEFAVRCLIGREKILKKTYADIDEAKLAAQRIFGNFLEKIEYE